jgi:hypothetical protein
MALSLMEDMRMARKRHTAEEIVAKLRQVDVLPAQGRPVAEAVRSIGVTEVTYYRWRSEYGGLKGDQIKRLKERSRPAISTVLATRPETRSSSQRRALAIPSTNRARVSERIGRAASTGAPSGPMISRARGGGVHAMTMGRDALG